MIIYPSMNTKVTDYRSITCWLKNLGLIDDIYRWPAFNIPVNLTDEQYTEFKLRFI